MIQIHVKLLRLIIKYSNEFIFKNYYSKSSYMGGAESKPINPIIYTYNNLINFNKFNWTSSYKIHTDIVIRFDDNITEIKEFIDQRLKISYIQEDDEQSLGVIKTICSYLNYLLYTSRTLNEFHPSVAFLHYCANNNLKLTQLHSFKHIFLIIKTFGFCSENDFITPSDISEIDTPSEEAYITAKKYKSINVMRVLNNLDHIKQILSNDEIILLGMPIFSNFLSSRTSANLSAPEVNDIEIGGISGIIVGYLENKQTFIVLLSKGKYWGDKGFIYVSYDYIVGNYGAELWVMSLNEELVQINNMNEQEMNASKFYRNSKNTKKNNSQSSTTNFIFG